jgi:predicted nucleic acid-binding protein
LLPHDPLALAAREAVARLIDRGEVVCVATQNLIELWSVATRPTSANGLGLPLAQAAREVDRVATMFPVLEDVPAIYAHWRDIVERVGITGRQVFDARLVAVMATYDVTRILTFDIDGFRRYPGITVVDPREPGARGPPRPR